MAVPELETQFNKTVFGSHKPVVQQRSTEIFSIREGCAITMENQRRDKGEEESHPR